jgi:hypothetical protein
MKCELPDVDYLFVSRLLEATLTIQMPRPQVKTLSKFYIWFNLGLCSSLKSVLILLSASKYLSLK